ncbi:Retrovirus-related Pol polyprotein from type-2 retrotransposable element R2DM [Araneus ventricosus]|uniref:Retrovirus-related Pol polyprotein from type-2 retrotransposable element R2DM n=1 Tax=Araneus ventricosus TaxID=182803 RepID=A0A4Y2WR30_ARAVE|nr:Retrovirus-related Pol polyprotein from type-2 retrotransposable element R2DM [Araneus ventricosus]
MMKSRKINSRTRNSLERNSYYFGGHSFTLVLSTVRAGHLVKLDSCVRAFVRRVLYLPTDCPNAYLYAAISDGGLGVPCLRYSVPVWRAARLTSLSTSMSPACLAGPPGDYLQRLQERAARGLLTADVNKFFAAKLYNSVDGLALSESAKVPKQHNWVASFNRFLSGRDFINLVKTRINCLPTASRCARGRLSKDKMCRAGCNHKETINHISQGCPRTHQRRVARHNAVSNYIKRGLENRGFTVFSEPVYKTPIGNRKPDLVAVKGKVAFVIDSQVVGESVELKRANQRKISYYRDNDTMLNQIRQLHRVDEVSVIAATLNLRGCWAAKSVEDLVVKNKMMTLNDLTVISTRVLIGTFSAFTLFNKSTWRTGVRV